jgi:hypothetical protein
MRPVMRAKVATLAPPRARFGPFPGAKVATLAPGGVLG